jgi:hypothetical protein
MRSAMQRPNQSERIRAASFCQHQRRVLTLVSGP